MISHCKLCRFRGGSVDNSWHLDQISNQDEIDVEKKEMPCKVEISMKNRSCNEFALCSCVKHERQGHGTKLMIIG